MYISISKNMQKKHNQIIKQNVLSYIFSKKKKFFWFKNVRGDLNLHKPKESH